MGSFLNYFIFSFLAGCIINFYAIIYYFVLKEADISLGIIGDIPINPYIVIVVVALLISIILEGILQVAIEAYYDGFNGKWRMFKDEDKRKYTFGGWCLYYFVIAPSILRASKYFFENTSESPMNIFVEDSKSVPTSHLNIDRAVRMCARVIERESKVIGIYRFRNVSFMMQLIRVSFFIVALASSVSMIGISLIKMCDNSVFIFNLISLIVSVIFIIIIPKMSYNIGKRYIRDVGETYEAFRLDLPIKK